LLLHVLVYRAFDADGPRALAELVERADDELFDKVLINSGHVLYGILPRETVTTYAFRCRRHNWEL